ncbi:MAG: tyrosine-type recombinase/integrase [Bacteriovorax sp.]|nr:tyrosine-type recombinase/integrase [Bacteriovorax sp.]
MTPEEVFRLLEKLNPLYRDLALVQYYCAGRIGEIAGIQIKNINLEKESLKIKETCLWCQTNKTFLELKPFPKNRETREVYIHKELKEIITRRLKQKHPNCDYLFHIDGKPLNYGTIQIHYRSAQRKAKLPYSGTHIFRHGMATLARQVGGGLDAVMAMTGHKTVKLAEKYSRIGNDVQKEVSLKILKRLGDVQMAHAEAEPDHQNVLAFPKSMA